MRRACQLVRTSLGRRLCQQACGAVAEWSKAHAWKVCMGQKLIVGSNPTRSANSHQRHQSVICRAILSRLIVAHCKKMRMNYALD